jgi:hypothetical protein
MTDYFTKTNTPTPYFDKTEHAPKKQSVVGSATSAKTSTTTSSSTTANTVDDPATQVKKEMSKAEGAYRKIAATVVTKRYAVRKD